jgi:hypothetical protein
VAKLKLRLLGWLFHKLFGDWKLTTQFYVTSTHILVIEIAVETRFGDFSFPFFQKELPAPGELAKVNMVPKDPTKVGGYRPEEDADTRPA